MDILCYGDSNTWGAIPGGGRFARLPREKRWTGRLEAALGGKYRVIEEGCNGRTTVLDDHAADGRNGLKTSVAILESHRPLGLIIVMLGTNDLKRRYCMSPTDIAAGLRRLVKAMQAYPCGNTEKARVPMLLIAPAPILHGVSQFWEGMYAEESVGDSEQLGALYAGVAKECGCAFLDAGSVARASKSDALHLDEAAHERLAMAIETKVREMGI